ncbi:MAG: ABC transporter permease, partial [Rhodoferax sp.]|nr:ABC transporter permease [Rhodoferax sp.]
MLSMARALWAFRGFVLTSVQREFAARYQNSMLGMAWMVIHPLSMIVVYTVIFSQLMRSRLPGVDGAFAYSVYLCAGILTWGLFAEVVTRAQTVFIDNANLLKKLSFPRLCLPLIVVLSAVLNFLVVFALFLIFLALSGNFPGWVILAFVPVLAIQLAFSVGLGMTLGVFNVFFRDVGQVATIVMQFWFWLTPIVYPREVLPANVQSWLDWNPMAVVVAAHQQIFVWHTLPAWRPLLGVALLALFLCGLGWRLFRRHAGAMVD